MPACLPVLPVYLSALLTSDPFRARGIASAPIATVLLQSMAQYPSGAECRDKFLVQAAWMPPSQPGSDEAQLISELWSKHAATEQARKNAGGAGAKQ